MRHYLIKIWGAVPILAALLFVTLLLVAFEVTPAKGFGSLLYGAFGNISNFLSTVAFWIPLLLASTGLLLTFKAGLWNIGVEGQMIMGAIGASWIALKFEGPRGILIPLEIIVAMIAGALWAAISAVLKTRGKVHEIFSGLALTNIAGIYTVYLISGPWQPPEGGSIHSTSPFQEAAVLFRLGTSNMSPLALILALLAFGIVVVVLSNTTWGLQLKALGQNPKSAFLLGVSSEKQAIFAMMFSGALAGLAGGLRVLTWFDRPSLRPNIAGGIGYLALMVIMLAAFQAYWVPFISFFFSSILNGSNVLHLRTALHSSFGGVLTAVMVLFVLLFGDAKKLGLQVQEQKDE